jgi:hypothetical protein
MRSGLKEANPEATFGDLNVLLGGKWKEVSAEDKVVYLEDAKAQKEQYTKDKAEYDEANPSPATGEDTEAEESPPKRARKAKRDPDAPKSPTTAYGLFANEHREEVAKANSTLNKKEVTAALKQLWTELIDEDKARFIGQHAAAKAQHEIDMAEFLRSTAYVAEPTDEMETEAAEARAESKGEETAASPPKSVKKSQSTDKPTDKKTPASKSAQAAPPSPAKNVKTMLDFFGGKKGAAKSTTKAKEASEPVAKVAEADAPEVTTEQNEEGDEVDAMDVETPVDEEKESSANVDAPAEGDNTVMTTDAVVEDAGPTDDEEDAAPPTQIVADIAAKVEVQAEVKSKPEVEPKATTTKSAPCFKPPTKSSESVTSSAATSADDYNPSKDR